MPRYGHRGPGPWSCPMRRRMFAAAALLVALAPVTWSSPATADMAQPAGVSANPVDYTPHVLDGTVWALAVVGDTVVVGGSFTKVTDSSRKQTYARKNVFAFGLHYGQIRTFAPQVDGAIYSLTAGPDYTVYLGGAFKTVN